MPYEIQFPEIPTGYSANSARAGETATVICQEFTSSEDGNRFISRLEGIPRTILSRLPGASHVHESTVDHLLAIIRPNKTATVFVNDLNYSLLIRAKGAVKKGDPVTLDQILDVTRLKLNGVTIPPEAGFVAVLSAGWRKGLFFDLCPLLPGGTPRAFDVEVTLGHYYAYLNFQHLFSIGDATWAALTSQGWFPFIHLRQSTLRQIIATADAGLPVDDHIDAIALDAVEAIKPRLDGWKSDLLLAEHYDFMATAFRHLERGDYLSATAILFPRIEGVLRSHHFAGIAAGSATQENLIRSTFARAELPAHGNSLLLPEKFRSYLRDIYFADFDPRNPTNLSRHTVSHGVAPRARFDRKGAILGFLILLQIVSLLPLARRAAP